MIRCTVLGSGTSTGVPSVGCLCETCTSPDPRDKRLRTSLLVQSDTTTIIIDTSSDFRQQMLQYQIQKIDAIVFTHHHFDHIGGFDDIRPYNFMGNKGPVQIYLMESTLKGLKQTFAYAFGAAEQSGGGLPQAEVHLIDQDPFQIGDITITPIPLLHGNMRVNGYKIGSMAYCTDTNFIPETSYTRLMGLDTLILDALRYEKHPTHFTIQQACVQAARIGAKKTYFTHIAHQIRHADCEANLPAGCYLSFDGLVINA